MSTLPFGQFQGEPLGRVPLHYLLSIVERAWFRKQHPALHYQVRHFVIGALIEAEAQDGGL